MSDLAPYHSGHCRTHVVGLFPSYGSDCTCGLELAVDLMIGDALLDDRLRTSDRSSATEALDAWEKKGPTSLTVALMAEALYRITGRTRGELCGGRDPAYEGTCPLPKRHPGGCFGDPEVDA